jgi:excinuclease ABC subunit C
MTPHPDVIAAKVPHLPESPGVYLFRDAAGTIVYVGKAKRLRSRVRNYLAADTQRASAKTFALMQHAVDVETIVVPTEAQALVLEANLIKEHRPRYNISLRDDKSYPYVKVTLQEPFPRVLVTRRILADGARYFGPYTDVGAMRRALNVVKRLFTVRSCTYDLPTDAPERPCLDYSIGRCKAPCVGLQSMSDYRAMIDEVVQFLDGRADEVIKRVRARMDQAAEALDFERAARLRDALKHLEQMEEPTVVTQVEGGDSDVVGFARDGEDACVTLLRIRDGKLLARAQRFLEHVEDETNGAVLTAYLASSYLAELERAHTVVLPFECEERELIAAALAGTRIIVPQRGTKRELVDLADRNARHLLEEFKLASLEADVRAADPVYELGRELGLQRIPRSFVCFDVSTTQGTDTVGSCVWFENGRAKRAEYRKFIVKSVDGTDDFAAMREIVGRYFERRRTDGDPLPDLVVVDGGKGQLGAAQEALTALGVEIPLASLAKREEDVFLVGHAEPLRLPRRSTALRLLQQARDEAHRFAVTYNRRRRAMRTLTSELLNVPGVGPAKRRQLLAAFGSLSAIRAADRAEIAKLPGFSVASAQRLIDALARSSPTNA